MDYDGFCILRVIGFYFFEEFEYVNRGERYFKIWLVGKVELSDEALWFFVGYVVNL